MEASKKIVEQFKVLLAIALCDDSLHPLEVSLLHDFAAKNYISLETQQELLLDPEKHLPNDITTIDIDLRFLVELARMIIADNVIDDKELEMLYKYADKSNLAGTNVKGWCHYLLELAGEGIEINEIRSELDMLNAL
jgi:hypothetical protein